MLWLGRVSPARFLAKIDAMSEALFLYVLPGPRIRFPDLRAAPIGPRSPSFRPWSCLFRPDLFRIIV